MFTNKDYIYEVYREKSFTTAAKKLYITQPALSFAVKKTEEKLGAEIFDRLHIPISLTEAGKAYIDAVERIYAIEDELHNHICDLADLKTGSLTVAGTNASFSCVLPPIIQRYSEKYPGITLKFLESSSTDIKDRVIEGNVDVTIDYDFPENLFISFPLKAEKIYLAASSESSFAKNHAGLALSAQAIKAGKGENGPAVNLSELANEPFVLLKKGNNMCTHAEALLQEAGIKSINDVMRLDQLMTAYHMAAHGLGLTFVTDTMISSELLNASYFRIDSPLAFRELMIAFRKSVTISTRLQAFIDVAREIYSV